MNAIEAGFLAVGLLLLWWYLQRRHSPRLSLLILAVCLPAFWLSIEECTQFLLIDEPRNLEEVVFIRIAPMRQWSNGELRTTGIVLGTLLNLIQLFTGWTSETYLMIAKALHWLSGIFAMALIYDLLATRYIIQRDKRWFSLVYWNLMLLLPVTTHVLKFFNYDLISMLLGTYALLLATVGLTGNNRGYLLAGLVVSFLAAQEKLIASPLLWMMICVFTCTEVNRVYQKGWPRRMVETLRSLGFALAVIFGIIILSYIVLLVNRGGNFPTEYSNRNPVKIIFPLIKIASVGLWLFVGSDNLLRFRSFAKGASPLSLISLLSGAMIAAVFLLTAAVPLIVGFVGKAECKMQSLAGRYCRRVQLFCGIILIVLFLVGIIATYEVRPYISPVKPISEGSYVPTRVFNNFSTHFGQKTFVGHMTAQIGYAYSVFFNIIPTVVVLLAIAVCFTGSLRTGLDPFKKYMLFLLGVSSLGIPLLYGIIQVPLAGRYFNLFICISGTALSVAAASLISRQKTVIKVLITGSIIVGLIAELFPFRSVYASFRPWWSDYSKRYYKQPHAGEINPWGLGSGITMCAGKRILEEQKGAPARLYYHFYGQWLGHPASIEVIDMTNTNVPFRYTAADYYVFHRCPVTQGWMRYPYGLEPLMTVSRRGLNQAWVFRGDQLAAAGFQF